MSRNNVASIKAKLQNYAKKHGQEFNKVLTRFALERLLFRLSISDHASQFLLKGALLFDIWFTIPHRSTKDIDLLGFGSPENGLMVDLFRDICSLPCEDGISFQSDSIQIFDIRKELNYQGIRIKLLGFLDRTRIPV